MEPEDMLRILTNGTATIHKLRSSELRKFAAEQIADLIERWDSSNIWGCLKDSPTRDQFVAALKLVRAGIDLDSPNIKLVLEVL